MGMKNLQILWRIFWCYCWWCTDDSFKIKKKQKSTVLITLEYYLTSTNQFWRIVQRWTSLKWWTIDQLWHDVCPIVSSTLKRTQNCVSSRPHIVRLLTANKFDKQSFLLSLFLVLELPHKDFAFKLFWKSWIIRILRENETTQTFPCSSAADFGFMRWTRKYTIGFR